MHPSYQNDKVLSEGDKVLSEGDKALSEGHAFKSQSTDNDSELFQKVSAANAFGHKPMVTNILVNGLQF